MKARPSELLASTATSSVLQPVMEWGLAEGADGQRAAESRPDEAQLRRSSAGDQLTVPKWSPGAIWAKGVTHLVVPHWGRIVSTLPQGNKGRGHR